MSVIDALSAGFGALGRSPGWALIPVAVDILLWLGPRLSPRPLVVRAFEDLSRLSTRLAAEGAADALEAWRQAAEQAGSVNLLGLITWWQVPTVIGPRPVPSPWPVPTIAVESWPLGLGLTGDGPDFALLFNLFWNVHHLECPDGRLGRGAPGGCRQRRRRLGPHPGDDGRLPGPVRPAAGG